MDPVQKEPKELKDWKKRLIHAAQSAIAEMKSIDSTFKKSYPLISNGNPRSEKWIDGVSCGLKQSNVLEWMLAIGILRPSFSNQIKMNKKFIKNESSILKTLETAHSELASVFSKEFEKMKLKVTQTLKSRKDKEMRFQNLAKKCSKIRVKGKPMTSGEALVFLDCLDEAGAVTIHCVADPQKGNNSIQFTRLIIRLNDSSESDGENTENKGHQNGDRHLEEPPRKKRKIDNRTKGFLDSDSDETENDESSNKPNDMDSSGSSSGIKGQSESAAKKPTSKMEEFFARRLKNSKMQNVDKKEKGSRSRKRNVVKTGGEGRYQRVKPRNNFENDALRDNQYDGKDAYASKAYSALKERKGKEFVKAKNKQKLKTMHGGGPIDVNAVNSIRFDD